MNMATSYAIHCSRQENQNLMSRLIDRMIFFILTFYASTESTERAFSVMKIIKTDLHSKMDNIFLVDIVVICIERHFTKKIDIKSMIDEFDNMIDPRAKLR